MITEEERYVERRMNWFDWLCFWSWCLPVAMVFAIAGNGVAGEPMDRTALLLVFIVGFGVSIVLRGIVLQVRLKRYRDDYYQEKRLR